MRSRLSTNTLLSKQQPGDGWTKQTSVKEFIVTAQIHQVKNEAPGRG